MSTAPSRSSERSRDDAGRGSARSPAPGLRERKKARTRRAIQVHTVRLIEAQGFAATTVDQIAEAADISPSTFFRYFRNKEDAAVSDFMDEEAFRMVMAAPAQLSPIEALRYGMHRSLESMSDEDWEHELRRSRLIWTVPELRRGLSEELTRPMRLTIVGVAQRLGVSEDSLEAKVLGGALIGGLLGLLMPLVPTDVAGPLPQTRAEVLALFDSALDVLGSILRTPG